MTTIRIRGEHTKLHAVTDAEGRPLSFFMTAGQVSDYTGAAALLDDLPKAQWMLGDRGYDADWYRDALQAKGITPCIPGRKSRIIPVTYDKRRYRSRSRIEIMFGRLKDWRRVATRYDRCPTVFFSAIALAATVIFWLGSMSRDPNAPAIPTAILHSTADTDVSIKLHLAGRHRSGPPRP
ncbi:transposase [Sphingomonas sp. Leaf339]|nr:transposase [Sphingomonas sp. Leaf339]